jgi:hypothetical protein
MAKEIKSTSVPPSAEEETINVWLSFGWELKNNQEVKTQDVQVFTGQDRDGTEHYQTKRGEHYVKLTFERDSGRPNYTELVSLEKQYYSINDPSCPIPPVRFGGIWIIISIVGLFIYIFPGLAVIVWRLVRYSEKKKEYNSEYLAYVQACKDNDNKRKAIVEKAKTLS